MPESAGNLGLTRPRVDPVRSVRRAAPLAKLNDSPHAKLVVIHAPAGFGKTTLLRQYCAELSERGGGRCVWVHLDETARDAPQFMRLVHTALRGHLGGAAQRPAARAIKSSSPREIRAALDAAGPGTVLVIDDYELACQAGANEVLYQLVRQLPQGVRIFLGTRVLPGALTSRLLVKGEALVLGADDVRFGLGETRALFSDSAGLAGDEVEWIQSCTEGWPAALQCFRLCISGGRFRRGLAYQGNGVTPELISYLATEVFEALSERTRQLLLATSLPDLVCPELVEHISDVRCTQDDLEGLVEAGLFLMPVDLDRRWYRFHNVFRRVMLARLTSDLDPPQLLARHRLAADWFTTNGYEEEAIKHLLAANDPEAAAALLDHRAWHLINEERLDFITSLVDELPEKTVKKYPDIQAAATIAYGFRREFAKANRMLEVHRRDLEQLKDAASEEQWGLFNSLQIFVLAAQDRMAEVASNAELTLSQLAPRHGLRYAVALNAHGFWLHANSKFEEARKELSEARPLHTHEHSLFGRAYQEAILSGVLTAQGRISDAKASLRTTLREIEQAISATAGSTIAAYLAEAHYEQNETAAAEELLADYLPLIDQQAIVDPLAITHLTRARIALRRNLPGEADRIIEHMMELGHRHDLRRLVHYGRTELVRQATLAGDMDLATRRLEAFFGGAEPKLHADLLFHAGEIEAQTITYARYLVHAGRYGEARALLQTQLRKAKLLRRRRRQMKLGLLLAIALDEEGEKALARRTLQDALEIGMPGEFVRSILDEGPRMTRLLKEVYSTRGRRPEIVENDPVNAYVEFLLRTDGERLEIEETIEAGVLDEDAVLRFDTLTAREREILTLVSNGFANKDLAGRLGVSTNTVKWHLRNVFEKLQISNRVQAISVARHFGLIN
ncbi:MAG: AAA family ATPase [Alphaproteobacteria bacterium]|nr:AAA family ATPase [Alphaproteobacteria bacterium]